MNNPGGGYDHSGFHQTKQNISIALGRGPHQKRKIPLARVFLGVLFFWLESGPRPETTGRGFGGWQWWSYLDGFGWRTLEVPSTGLNITQLDPPVGGRLTSWQSFPKDHLTIPKKVTKNWQGESVLGLCCLRGHHHLFLTLWWLMRFHICCWDKRKDMTQVSTIQYLCNPPKL